jgi:hypothetical protein
MCRRLAVCLVGAIALHAVVRGASAQEPIARPPVLPVSVTTTEAAVEYLGAAPGLNGAVTSPVLPCRVLAQARLQPIVEASWAGSPTFRKQCLALAQAGAVVLLQIDSVEQTRWAAESRIGRLPSGRVMARVRVRDGRESPEVVGHELEHVLERIEGRHPALDPGGTSAGGAYETRRAQRAGRQVAEEVAKTRP